MSTLEKSKVGKLTTENGKIMCAFLKIQLLIGAIKYAANIPLSFSSYLMNLNKDLSTKSWCTLSLLST